MLILYSVASGGLKPKQLDFFRREIIQSYGIGYLPLLHRLDQLELLSTNSPFLKNYTTIRKKLNLIVDDVDEHNPKDISYVYSGYAPISVRLVERLSSVQPEKSWHGSGLEDVLKAMPGAVVEETQAGVTKGGFFLLSPSIFLYVAVIDTSVMQWRPSPRRWLCS